jgi:predicted cupin superfamily sugar epimerase
MKAQDWIKKLKLIAHPEGGYYKETYRSDENIRASVLPERFNGDRSISTSIYFLLESNQVSKFHRIKSDEIWHFYEGSPLSIYMIDQWGDLEKIILGRDIDKDQKLQYAVPRGCWFGAEVVEDNSYTLVGCTVAPGFDFQDFEMAKREELLKQYPDQKEIIEKLTD